jgi:hypothetical protein
VGAAPAREQRKTKKSGETCAHADPHCIKNTGDRQVRTLAHRTAAKSAALVSVVLRREQP